ncbi:hypothetical protein RB595_003481 [Gaeumannomyces hyphopodioides]
MPSITQALVVLCSAMAAVSASPAARRLEGRQKADASLAQVANPGLARRDPSVELFEAYTKYNMHVPRELAAYVEAAEERKANLRRRGLQGCADLKPHDGEKDWLTTIRVGSPPQTLHVVLDTDFSTTWFYSDLMPANQQRNHAVYSPSKSKTAAKIDFTNSVDYQDGQFSGTLAGGMFTDVVSFGNGVEYKQPFMAVNSTSRPDVNGFSGVDGVLGLGFSGYEGIADKEIAEVSKSFFENIKDRLSTPTMGFDQRHKKSGWVDLGVVPKGRYVGELSYLPVDKSNFYWNMTAAGYAIGSAADFKAEPLTGVADTAITFLLLPDSICKPYYASVKGSHYNSPLGGYVFPCDAKLPDLFVKMGETMIKVPGSYFNYTDLTDDNGKATGECFGGLQIAWMEFFGDGNKINIFGTMIHKAAYVVYEDGKAGTRIGWANKKL